MFAFACYSFTMIVEAVTATPIDGFSIEAVAIDDTQIIRSFEFKTGHQRILATAIVDDASSRALFAGIPRSAP